MTTESRDQKIDRLAKAWFEGRRDEVIAEMGQLKPSEAVEMIYALMGLEARAKDFSGKRQMEFIAALQQEGY